MQFNPTASVQTFNALANCPSCPDLLRVQLMPSGLQGNLGDNDHPPEAGHSLWAYLLAPIGCKKRFSNSATACVRLVRRSSVTGFQRFHPLPLFDRPPSAGYRYADGLQVISGAKLIVLARVRSTSAGDTLGESECLGIRPGLPALKLRDRRPFIKAISKQFCRVPDHRELV